MTFASSSIPFRFRAGSTMAPEAFHHRRSSQNSHKPFKSRHATKSLFKELSKGKIDGAGRNGSRKTPHQQVMSKFDRRNQAKQIREIKHAQNVKSMSVFAGANGAPRIVAVIPLSGKVNVKVAIERLTDVVDGEAQWPIGRHIGVRMDRFKQNLMFIPVKRSLLEAMDASRVADFVVLLLSPEEESNKESATMLRAIEGQGISNVFTMVQGLAKIEPVKKRTQTVADLKTWITRFFPQQEKVLNLDADSECVNAVRSLCTTTTKGVHWRDTRSWMLIEDVRWPENVPNTEAATGEVVVTGVVRGKALKADRLVQLGDWGQYQVEKIANAALPNSRKRKAEEMVIDQSTLENVLEVPSAEQDDMDELAPYEASMDDVNEVPASESVTERRGVLLDDHHYYSDDDGHLPEPPKRLPKGTSNYQSAWFLGDMSDSGSDFDDAADGEDDIHMGSPALPQDGIEGLDQATQPDVTEIASEYPASEMFVDRSPNEEAAQIQAYRASRKDEAKDDLEFPDEIELHPNVIARERLAKYRGLKSLKTSTWDTSEDRRHEPEDWNRLLQVLDYKRAKKQAENDALAGGIQPGTRVHVHLRSVPLSLLESHNPTEPLTLYSLLRHEHKRTVVNISITLPSSHPTPLKSKDELILQCGARRFTINPLFSQLGNTPNDVHKFMRYLHPGQTAVASFTGPVTWGAVPALFFQRSPSSNYSAELNLIATGTALAPSTSRIIAKRVILTGHPYKIHRKLVTVRYMFFNREDVNWFKALQLWTKRGRSGFIKESLGTHGYFKATFDGRINPQDAIGVSLYKRVWPRVAKTWRREQLEEGGMGIEAEVEGEMVED